MKNTLLFKKVNTFMFWCVALLLLSMTSLSYGQASLPVFRTAWGTPEPTGWTNSGCSHRTTSFACTGNSATTFDTTNDTRILNFNAAPNQIVFQLKRSTMSGESKLVVTQSADGITYSAAIGTYGTAAGATAITDCANITLSLLSTTRFVKWVYTKAGGNCDMDEVSVTAPASIITGGTISVTAFTTTYGTASASQTFPVSGTLLSADLVATAQAGFEVSRNDVVSYGPTASYTAAEANAGGVSFLVRLKNNANAISYNSQNAVVLSSSPAVNANIVTSASGNAVTPFGLTISGFSSQDKQFDGNTTATLLGSATLNGVLFSDDVSLSGSAVANYSSAAVGGPYVVTFTGFSLSGTKAANYSLSQPTVANASITPSTLDDQVITFPALTSVPYGTISVALLATSDNPGGNPITYVSSNTNVATISGSSAIIVGAGTTTITASQAGDVTHNPAIEVPQSLTVTPLGITIIGLSAQDKPYDNTTTATLTGTPVLDPAPINSDDVTISGTPVANFATANGGTQAVTVTGYSLGGTKAGNYSLTQPVVADATITPLTQTITFFGTIPTLTTLTPAVTLTATASSGLPVTFESSDTNVATISGNVMTILAAGSVTITAKQAGNSNYGAAPDVAQTRTVETALYLNQFTGASACPTSGNVATVASNTIGAAASRITVSCATFANFFSSTSINNTASINNNSFVEFSATAASGYRFNLTKLALARSGSGTCPNQLEVRYSTDGFATSTSMSNSALTTTTATTLTWDFADFNTPVSGTITFRLYPYGTQRADLAGGAAADSGTFRIDDVIIYGAVLLPPPTITTTTPPSVINDLSATLGGNVTNTGGSSITGNGVVIAETSLNSNPIIGGANVTDIVNGSFTTETGTFSVSSSSLTPNTQYSYAAYATNAQGTSYGSVSTFYTLAVVPTVAPAVDNETFTTLDINLGSANESNSVNTEFAIRVVSGSNTYYLQSDYTLGINPVWQDGSTWGAGATVTGLISNTAYTFDVKARNGAGIETAFGPSTTLATLEIFDANLVLTSAAPAFGNVCTTGATNFATTSFTLNGFYLDAADFSVASAAGQLSFSTSENGTYSNPLVVSHDSPTMTGQVIWVQFTPSSTGAFSGTIAITGGGLLSSFDVIATGTGINTPATVTTGAVSAIDIVSATITGTASPGCSAIIASGIEYSTASDFTGAIQVTEAYPITLTTLSPNTLYYVRAFATDSSAAGIAYGTSTSFTTLALTTGPIADEATSIEATSFVVNWQAVTGAESYLLDVSTNPDFVGAITTVANWNFPLATDNNIIDAGIAANTSNTLTTIGGVGTISYVPASSSATSAASGNGWDAGNGTKYWQIDIATTGYSDLKLSSAQRSSGTGPRDFKVQYSVNAGANWFDVSGSSVTVGNNWTTGVLSNISLPTACNNQASVRLRWIMTSNTNVSAGSVAGTGTSGIDNILVTGRPPSFSVHEGLSVNGLSQFVSGLSELTTYHYRVRAFSANSTSPNSNVISVTTTAAPPTFDSVSYIGSTVCDGANGTFDVAGLLPNVVSKIYYNIDNGATQSVLTTVADNSGAATFAIPLALSANNTVLTITTVARADDSSSLTVESGGQVFLNFIAANVTYYSDADNDTFGNSLLSQLSCIGAPSGYVSNNTDCNPNDGSKWQFASFFVDTDADGYDNGTASVCSGLTAPVGYSATTSGVDCDDTDNTKWQSTILYTDVDGDGYTVGTPGSVCYGATLPAGTSLTSSGFDCDDSNNLVWQSNILYTDADGDTYTVGTGTVTCYGATLPAGTTLTQNGNDCNDNNGAIYQIVKYFVDADEDGYDNQAATVCSGVGAPAGYSATTLGPDCDDTNAAIYQLALFYVDADGDTYGSTASSALASVCSGVGAPSGYSVTNDDCDDTNALLNPTNPCANGKVVNLTMFIEGYYLSASTMNSVKFNQDGISPATEVEDLTVELHDATTYTLVDTAIGTLNTDGTLSVTFNTAAAGSYYVAVKGVNMIETWSADPQAVGAAPLSYDFSSAAAQAYGSNMREIEPGVFAFYQGDINQDGSIDNSDYDQLFPDIENSAFGVQPTDLNGDGAVDNSDTDFIPFNVENSIYANYPF